MSLTGYVALLPVEKVRVKLGPLTFYRFRHFLDDGSDCVTFYYVDVPVIGAGVAVHIPAVFHRVLINLGVLDLNDFRLNAEQMADLARCGFARPKNVPLPENEGP
jgi:hypothetical protein